MLTKKNLYILVSVLFIFSCQWKQVEKTPDGEFWLERGCSYREAGQWEKALADFDTALCTVSPLQIILERAITRYQMGEYKTVIELLDERRDCTWESFLYPPQHPLRKEIYYWSGLAQLQEEEYQEAWYNFEAAATLGHAEATIEYKKVAERLNWPGEVLQCLNREPAEVTFTDGTCYLLTQQLNISTKAEEYTLISWESKQLPVDYIHMRFRNYDGKYEDDYFYSGKTSPYKEWHYKKVPFLLYSLVKEFYYEPDDFMMNYCEVASGGKKIDLFGQRMDFVLYPDNPYILGDYFTNPSTPYLMDVVLFRYQLGEEEVNFLLLPGSFIRDRRYRR